MKHLCPVCGQYEFTRRSANPLDAAIWAARYVAGLMTQCWNWSQISMAES